MYSFGGGPLRVLGVKVKIPICTQYGQSPQIRIPREVGFNHFTSFARTHNAPSYQILNKINRSTDELLMTQPILPPAFRGWAIFSAYGA